MSLKDKYFLFGPFRLEPANLLLLRDGKHVPLSPKAFDTLVYLVENSKRLVTRSELMHAIWPDSFVEDANLTVNISILRKGLGEMSDGRPYIETVPRKGYRFNAEVKILDLEIPESSIVPGPIVVTSTAVRTTKKPEELEESSLEAPHSEPAGGRSSEAVARQPEVIAFPGSERPPRTSITAGESQRLNPARRWALLWIAGLVVAGILAGWAIWRRSEQPLQLVQRRLTSFAPEMAVTAAAISTGSKFIAYANPGGLFIQVIASSETRALMLPKPHFDVSSISWFPDSAELLVGGSSPGDTAPSLWIVPVIGSNPPVELGPYPSGVVSPDGTEIAWVSSLGPAPEIQLTSSSGGPVQTVVTGAPGEIFGSVSWRHNGRGLLFTRYRWNSQFRGNSGSIDEYDLRTGKTVAVLSGKDFGGDAVSIRNGRVVYSRILGANPVAEGGELLEVHTDPRTAKGLGNPRVLAEWNAPITGLSVSASGRFLTVRDLVSQHSVYVADLMGSPPRLKHMRRLTFGESSDDFPRAWSHDSKTLFFDSNRSGHWEIYKRHLASGLDEAFVRGPDDAFSPRISPDGKWLLYLDRPRVWQEPQPVSVMRVPISGGPPQLVLTAAEFSEWGLRFDCPYRAGRPCILAERQGSETVFRSFDPLKGFEGPPKGIAHVEFDPHTTFNWGISPDGSRLAWVRSEPREARIHVLSLPGSGSNRLAQTAPDIVLKGWSHLHAISWSSNGRGWFITTELPDHWTLLYADSDGRTRVLRQETSAFTPRALPSPDGRDLAFAEKNASSNAWLLENF